MEPGGQSRERLTTGGEARSPTWSPDGRTLAYVYQESTDELRRAILYEMDDRRHSHALGNPDRYLRSLAWSPDGRYLLFDSGTGVAGRVVIVEVTTGRVIHELEAVGYTWSPDSGHLAVGQPQPLETPISVEGGDSVSLAVLEMGRQRPQVVFEGSSEVLYFPLAWLPDDRLLYDRLDWNEKTQHGEHSRWMITLDGPVSTPQPATGIPPAFDREAILARLPKAFQDPATGSFSWSSDGRWLVFHAGEWPDMGVYLLDWEEGEQPHRLADGAWPAWQPCLTAPPPYQDWQTYIDPAYGFLFHYPQGWKAEEAPNFVRLRYAQRPTLVLTIGFRHATEEASIQRTGVGAGDIVTKGTVTFLGRELSRDVLVYQGREKAVLYNYALEIPVDELVFTLSLDDLDPEYMSVLIEPGIQTVVDRIIESFELTH